LRRHASLQYRTCSQFRAQRFLQAKGRPQTGQVFSGRCGFLCAAFTCLLMPLSCAAAEFCLPQSSGRACL